MKFLISALMMFIVVSQASAMSCSELIRSRSKDQLSIGALGTGLSLAAGAGVAAGVVVGSGMILLPATLGLGVTLIVKGAHGKSIATLLEQSESCEGKKIDKLWNKYQEKNVSDISKAEFCQAISNANKSGAACNVESTPERSEILKISLDA